MVENPKNKKSIAHSSKFRRQDKKKPKGMGSSKMNFLLDTNFNHIPEVENA
jgi:hypothetical protein